MLPHGGRSLRCRHNVGSSQGSQLSIARKLAAGTHGPAQFILRMRVGHQVGNIIAIITRIVMKSRMLQNTILMSQFVCRCVVHPEPSFNAKRQNLLE
jgi:hypothetical protein